MQRFLVVALSLFAEHHKSSQIEVENHIESLKEPMYKPLIEGYLIDEVKNFGIAEQGSDPDESLAVTYSLSSFRRLSRYSSSILFSTFSLTLSSMKSTTSL